MNPRDPNVAKVELVAHALGELCEELVFVGGCAVGLLSTDLGAPPPRATIDVDLVVEVASLAEYHRMERELERRGFAHDHAPEAPICRWRYRGLAVDLMPAEERILGFANRWYPRVVHEDQRVVLPGGASIRLVSAPLFLASKLEAFSDRGMKDPMASHDLEDIVNLVEARSGLVAEVASLDMQLRGYVAERCRAILALPRFMNYLPGLLGDEGTLEERVARVSARFLELAVLDAR